MEVCYKCDIAYNEKQCPLCEAKEEITSWAGEPSSLRCPNSVHSAVKLGHNGSNSVTLRHCRFLL